MLSKILTVALATAAVAAPAPVAPAANVEPRVVVCYSGVYMIAARGTTEAAGFGKVGAVVNGTLAAIPDSGAVALDYPATYVEPLYSDSVILGIQKMKTLIQDYVDVCPDGKIVLAGFSQGGNVVTDVLAGGILKPAPLDASYVKHISAVTVFGDPTFTRNQTFDVGTNTVNNGIFSRQGAHLALLNNYADKVQSYCNTGDVYCAQGNNKTVHGLEIPTWGDAAVKFIVEKST